MVGRSWFVPDLEFQSFALIHFGIRSALSPGNSRQAAMEYKGIGTGGSRTIFKGKMNPPRLTSPEAD